MTELSTTDYLLLGIIVGCFIMIFLACCPACRAQFSRRGVHNTIAMLQRYRSIDNISINGETQLIGIGVDRCENLGSNIDELEVTVRILTPSSSLRPTIEADPVDTRVPVIDADPYIRRSTVS